MARRLTHEEVERRITEIHGDRFTLLGRYIKRDIKVKTLCNHCDYIWDVSLENLWTGHGCPSCSGKARVDTNLFKHMVLKEVGDEYVVLGEYKTTNTPILLKHTVCGHEFRMTPKNFIRNGQRCPKSRYKRSAKSNEITQGSPDEQNYKLKELCDMEGYEVLKGYVNASTNLELKHIKCGNIYKPRPYGFMVQGYRCHCENQSKGERVIGQWLIDSHIEYKAEYKFSDCRGTMHLLPFDFALFLDNSLLLLIEFDGIQHFKPKFGEDSLRETQRNDKIKNEYCNDNEIPLIRIKYNRALKLENFKKRVIDELIESINMTIPSEASEKLLERVTTR